MTILKDNGEVTTRRVGGEIRKESTTQGGQIAIARERLSLEMMAGSGVTPLPTANGQEDLGGSEPITDPEAFRRVCIRLLWETRRRRLRHGDLTMANLIVKDGGRRVYAIDWQEAHYIDEEGPQKSPWSDSWLLMRTIADATEDSTRTARRWRAILEALGLDRHDPERYRVAARQTWLDLGGFQGDIAALAACEGMVAWMVDTGRFSSGDSIAEAREIFGYIEGWSEGWSSGVFRDDIIRWTAGTPTLEFDYISLLSVWPYILRDHGREAADRLLAWCIDHASHAFFFEVQYRGDGPGSPWANDLECESALAALARDGLGIVVSPEPIARIPVAGRDATRTLWAIRKERQS